MKLSLGIVTARALGRRLGAVLEVLGRTEQTAPQRLTLFSRGTVAVDREAALAVAATSATDTCVVHTSLGQLQVRWLYGPKAHVQSITGELRAEDEGTLAAVRQAFTDVAEAVDAVYGYCDTKQVVDADVKAIGGMVFREDALVGVYWLNWLGRPYETLLAFDAIEKQVASVDRRANGTCIVLTNRPGDAEAARELAAQWPVRRYDAGARFGAPLEVDLSEVRGLSKPTSATATVGSIVGDPDAFISSAAAHAERFLEWAKQRAVSVSDPHALLKSIRAHEGELVGNRDLLVSAIAAYGELLARQTGGRWSKARLVHRGEPVIKGPGPFDSRRVVYEVLEAISG
jgi:hypothetical protein